MSVFKQIEKFNFTDHYIDVNINNIYTANDHFGNSKSIIEFAKSLDTALHSVEYDDRYILTYNICNYLKDFPRIKKVEFYLDDPMLIRKEDFIFWKVLIVSDVLGFNKSDNYNRYIEFVFKDHKITLSLVELYKPEYKLVIDKKQELPEYWQLQPNMTKQYNKLKVLFNE